METPAISFEPQSKEYTLYGLKHPKESRIRYIGITSDLLLNRLYGHRKDSGRNLHKNRWFSKMLPLIPEIVPFAVGLTEDQACDLEIAVIKGLRELGEDLLNISGGGNLPPVNLKGWPMTEDGKIKISKAHQGRVHSREHREKVSKSLEGNQRRRGVWTPPEIRIKISSSSLVKTSKFLGVYWDKSGRGKKKWRAQIFAKGKRICLGRFSSEEEAAMKYKEASENLWKS